MIRYLLSVALLTLYCSSIAQFTLSGEFRPRSEYRHGFNTLSEIDQDPAFFVEQRTRLNLGFVDEKYEFKIVFQDVRVWGSQPQLVTNDGSLTTLHEAWGILKLTDNSKLKMGRQEIILDDARIFGNVAWAQQARSHDAILFENSNDNFTLKLAAAYNQDGPQVITNYYTVTNNYKTMQFAWFGKKIAGIQSGILFLNNGRQGGTLADPATEFSQTIGARLDSDLGTFKPGGSFYYQTGKEPDGMAIGAYQFQLDVTYQIDEHTKLQVAIEQMSGNDEVNPSSANQAFNPFYGTNHKFNGLMDYFFVGNHINSVGLQDIFLQLDSKLGKFDAQSQVHFFSAAGALMDPQTSEEASKYLGTEIDLVFNYQPSKDINLEFGYSQMFGTASMEILKGGDASAFNNWGWVMLTISPTLFTTANKD